MYSTGPHADTSPNKANQIEKQWIFSIPDHPCPKSGARSMGRRKIAQENTSKEPDDQVFR
jgi:hypothetical protein